MTKKQKFLVAIRINRKGEIFQFPTRAKRKSFTDELRKRKVKFATSILTERNKKKSK